MKKSEFLKIEKKYLEDRVRLQAIKSGDLVWGPVSGGPWDIDYHPAIVKDVNVDEDYLTAIEIGFENKERRYASSSVMTESEFMRVEGVTRELIEAEHKKYRGIINKLKEVQNAR